jgi:hypothetical protein
MKTLEEEAEEKYREFPTNPIDKSEWRYNRDVHCFKKRKAFISGANSNWVQVEKVKAQLEAVRAVDTYGIKHMLEYYENKLKELEDGRV